MTDLGINVCSGDCGDHNCMCAELAESCSSKFNKDESCRWVNFPAKPFRRIPFVNQRGCVFCLRTQTWSDGEMAYADDE